ncbi:MAG TPA: alpha/beta hydrolase [Burkholderiales bacterium]
MIRSHAILLTVIGILSLAGCAGMSSPTEPRLVTESYMIQSRDAGIQLFVRNKRPQDMTQFGPEKTLLYVHGATQASETTFDLQLEGLSWMDYLAQRGYDVYLVDVRGYGQSTRPPEMEQPSANNPPIVRTDTAVMDVGAAIDHILARRNLPRINLMGWSWGCAIMADYTTQNNDKVNRLILYAPGWLRTAPTSVQPPLGAYQTWTMEQARSRLQNGAPEEKNKELMTTAWFETWSAAALATDPVGAKQNPPVVRTPNGVNQDTLDYWMMGKPEWEPAKVTVPTLVVRGEWDAVNPLSGTQSVFDKLTNAPYRRLVQIGEGTHFLFLEKNRLQLFREVQLFLDEPSLTK